jgi:hypothetical protein
MRLKNPIDDKKKVIDKLKTSSSLNEGLVNDINEINNASKKFYGNLQSVQDTNTSPIDFLVDIIITILGSGKLEEIINTVTSKLLRKDTKQENGRSLEENIKEALYKSLMVKNDSQLIPETFITSGYRIPVKAIDLFDLYKTNPSSPMGKLMYGTDTNNFNYMFQSNVLMNPLATSQEQRLNSLDSITFQNDVSGLFVDIKSSSSVSGDTTINNFFYNTIMDDSFELFDKKKIMADMIDAIYNYMSKGKTKGSLQTEEILKSLIDNIANERETDTVFDFNPKTLENIEKNINKRKEGGFNLDLACNVTSIEMGLDEIETILNSESFSTAILQPMGQAGNQALEESVYRGLLKSLLFIILKNTIFSPRLWTLFIISSIFKTGYNESIYYRMGTESISQQQLTFTILKDKNKIIEFIGNTLLKALCDFLLAIVIKEVTKIMTGMMTEICRERVIQAKDLIKSLMDIKLF